MSLSKLENRKQCKLSIKWVVKEEDINILDGKVSVGKIGTCFPSLKVNFFNIVKKGEGICFGLDVENDDSFDKVQLDIHFKVGRMNKYRIWFPANHGTSILTPISMFSVADASELVSNYFMDGLMTVEVIGKIKVVEHDFGKRAISSDLQKFLWDDFPTDFEIDCGGRWPKRVHKCVLSQKSNYLKRKLISNHKLTPLKKIKFENVSHSCVTNFVRHCYGMKMVVDKDGAIELLKFSQVYEAYTLRDEVVALVKKNMDKDTVCDAIQIARESNNEELLEYGICFLVKLSKKRVNVAGVKDIGKAFLAEVARRSFFITFNNDSVI